MPWVALAAGAVQIGTSLIGNSAASGKRKEAELAAAKATREIEEVGAAPDLAREIFYKHFEEAGLLDPKAEEIINLGVSKLSQITEDSKNREIQSSALNLLKERAEGGLNAEDRAGFNKLRAETATATQGKIQQILQNMQARGLGGSGAELVAQLNATQEGANRASEEGDRIAAEASRNALAAAVSSGNLAGNIRTQDFDVAKTKAESADAIEKFNTTNQINLQQRNTDRTNEAAAKNLASKQAIMNANIQMQNQELVRQREASRQKYLDDMEAAKTRANAYNGQAQQARADAQQTAQTWQNIGSGLSSAISGVGDGISKQEQTDYDRNQDKLKINSYRESKGLKLIP